MLSNFEETGSITSTQDVLPFSLCSYFVIDEDKLAETGSDVEKKQKTISSVIDTSRALRFISAAG